jgi:hypothetical protein
MAWWATATPSIAINGVAQPPAGTADRTLRVLGKAPIRSRSARPGGALLDAARAGRQLNASARHHASGDGEVISRGQTDENSIESDQHD